MYTWIPMIHQQMCLIILEITRKVLKKKFSEAAVRTQTRKHVRKKDYMSPFVPVSEMLPMLLCRHAYSLLAFLHSCCLLAHWQHFWWNAWSLTAYMFCHCGFCCPPSPMDLVMTFLLLWFPLLWCVLTLVFISVFSYHLMLESSLWTQSWSIADPIGPLYELWLGCSQHLNLAWVAGSTLHI